MRAYVFRVTSESGHSAVRSACRKRAKNGNGSFCRYLIFRRYLCFYVLIRPSTSGFTTLVGLPAAYATIWSKMSANWISYSSRVT